LENDIKELHRLFYYRIDKDEAGQYRKVKVFISGSKYPLPLPENIAGLMEEFIAGLPKQRKELHPSSFAPKPIKNSSLSILSSTGTEGSRVIDEPASSSGRIQYRGYLPDKPSRIYRGARKAHTDDGDFIALIADCVKENAEGLYQAF